jgi:hypothetical protein
MELYSFPSGRPSPTTANRVTMTVLRGSSFCPARGDRLRSSVSRANLEHDLAEIIGLTDRCELDSLVQSRRGGPGAFNTGIGERAVQLRNLVSLAALAIGLAACSQEVEYTPDQRSCIAQHYTNYDARRLSQCVDVCKVCMRGNVVTCNTSCKLRGAS